MGRGILLLGVVLHILPQFNIAAPLPPTHPAHREVLKAQALQLLVQPVCRLRALALAQRASERVYAQEPASHTSQQNLKASLLNNVQSRNQNLVLNGLPRTMVFLVGTVPY